MISNQLNSYSLFNKIKMNRSIKSSLQRQIPVYQVNVNVSDFQYRKSSLKEKLQREYIPYYWEKCKMSQKTIQQSSEDRLSELTTGQIDRIIDMEKIKSLLYDRKRRVKEAYFQYDEHKPNQHANIYQANFLARINEIAIKRDIRHEDLEGFDELIKQKLQKLKQNRDQKKKLLMPYKYAKKYKCDEISERKVKTEHSEDDYEKSIESIEDDLDQFEQKISSTRKELSRSLTKRDRSKVQVNKLLPPKRWFYGMSTYYLNKNQPQKVPEKREIAKSNCYDIESEVSLINQMKSSSFSTSKTHKNITQSTASSKNREHLLRNKANRIAMLKMI